VDSDEIEPGFVQGGRLLALIQVGDQVRVRVERMVTQDGMQVVLEIPFRLCGGLDFLELPSLLAPKAQKCPQAAPGSP
jgi:hypothetical protein